MGPVTFRSDARLMPETAVPRIEITGDLLELFERWPADDARMERAPDGRIVGSLIRMNYRDRYLVWRITDEVWPADTYHGSVYAAEWPD